MAESRVLRVIYKKIVEGDLSKFQAASNISLTGGGARDLRFSPSNEFWPEFGKMFALDMATGNLTGFVHWDDGTLTEVIIHSPTKARSNEVRIGQVNKCVPTSVVPLDAKDCVLLLYQDENGIYGTFRSEYSLIHDTWDPLFVRPIIRGLNAERRADNTPMGFVDFEYRKEFTNGN